VSVFDDTVLWLTGMHLWRSEFVPFIRQAQYRFCKHLIVVPLSTFHHLAELIGDPKGEVIFLFNTGRCGSTLLTEVLSLNQLDAFLRKIILLLDFPSCNFPVFTKFVHVVVLFLCSVPVYLLILSKLFGNSPPIWIVYSAELML